MTFTVTYRGADGAVRTEAVEAASRADCFAQMRARGIMPTGVKSGGKKSNRAERAEHVERSGEGCSARSTRLNKGLVAVILILTAVCGGMWWRLGRDEAQHSTEPDTPKKPMAFAKEVRPAAASKADSAPVGPVATNPPAAVVPPELQPEMYMGKRVVSRVETTNAAGRVKAVLTTEDGLTHRVYVDVPGNDRIILKRGTDHVLAAVLGVPSGTDAPPVPLDEGMEAEFLESLKEPIEDLETDTTEERRVKNLVRQGREDMKTLMDQGMSFRQIILEHQARAKENSIIRLKIIQEAARIREKHGEEEEAKYRTTMNAALERMGILPVGDGKPRVRPHAQPPQQ